MNMEGKGSVINMNVIRREEEDSASNHIGVIVGKSSYGLLHSIELDPSIYNLMPRQAKLCGLKTGGLGKGKNAMELIRSPRLSSGCSSYHCDPGSFHHLHEEEKGEPTKKSHRDWRWIPIHEYVSVRLASSGY